ncbi:STT3 domain-containing protein [Caldivirga sp.]|uniref:STT3 domain-containing protein n=1 Tax=Caldivirga sp. TaxID=2080243 RepID=UPI003D0BE458
MVKAGGGKKGSAAKSPTKTRVSLSSAELRELRSTQWFGLLAALAAVFTTGLYIRLYPAFLWGNYINEFDPYIRYYLTEFMLKMGAIKGIEWWLSGGLINGHLYINTHFWYPWGINWATTLSPGVSFTGLILYDILVKHLHLHLTLLSIAVYTPGIVNALSVLSMYYLGSRFGGRYVGLLTALMTAFSLIFLQRGEASWYADATLFQFIAPLGMALFIEALRQRNWIPYAILAAVVNGSLVWFWGSFTFVLNAYGAYAILLSIYVLYRLYKGRVIPLRVTDGISVDPVNALGTYTLTYLGFAAFLAMTPRYRLHAVLGLGALGTLAVLLAVVAIIVVMLERLGARKLVTASKYVIAAAVIFLVIVIALALSGISVLIHIPGGKYLAALFPTARSALVQSVAEHSPSTAHQLLSTTGYTLPFEVTGLTYALSTVDVAGLLLSITAVLSVYFASGEAWLTMLMFAWLPVAAYGLYLIIKFVARRGVDVIGLLTVAVVTALFAVSVIVIAQSSVPIAAAPQQIVSTTEPAIPSSDWLDALYWIQYNTPHDSVLASWWDYGYWLAIMGNRTSLADNSTVNGTQIKLIATAFTSTNVTESLELLRSVGADYVVVFLPYYPFPITVPSPMSALSIGGSSSQSMVALCALYPEYPTGGDFVKSYWMSTISGNSPEYTNTHILSAAEIISSTPTGGTATYNLYVPLANTTLYRLLFDLEAPAYSINVDQCLTQIRTTTTATPLTLPLWLFNTWPTYSQSSSSSSSAVHLVMTFQPILGQSLIPPPFVGTNTTLLNELYFTWFYGNWLTPPPGFQLVYVSRPNGWVLVYRINYSVLNSTLS